MRMNEIIGLKEEETVPMAPLIDCVFLLLVFFLSTATLQKAHRDIGVSLPDAGSARKAKTKHDTLIIEVTQNGRYYLNSQPASKQFLHQALREAALSTPPPEVRIDGDKRVAFEYIAYLLDLLQFEGLNNVNLRSRDKEE
jgi:biopolymer transport protein ExbD